MKKHKRALMLVLALILALGIMAVPASAGSTAAGGDGVYNSRYEGQAKEISKHKFTFQWCTDDYPLEPVRNKHHKTQIFEVVNTQSAGETAYAYCSDFICSIIEGANYKRINLEDSTYYNDAAAEHIRAIMDKGYWYTWTDADLKAAEDAANQWLSSYEVGSFHTAAFMPGDAEEAVSPISGLTRDEALMATQLAIWGFANTEGDGYWMKFYESLLPADYVEGSTVRYDIQELPSNVKTFRKYLLHQQARQAAADEIVFTNDYFITTTAVFAASDDRSNTESRDSMATYDVTVMFRLATDIDARDQLTLTAQAGDAESQSYPLCGDSALTRTRSGYYSVTLNDVPGRDLDKGITLALSGKQWTSGICFYEAEPADGSDARETSQNLVGKYEGLTAVAASASFEVDVREGELALVKYDATTEVAPDAADCVIDGKPYKALGDAVFDLYVLADDDYVRIAAGLVSGDDGFIRVSGLPEGYEYYFKEVSAPEGYEISGPEYIHAPLVAAGADDQGVVYVGNSKKAEPPKDPVVPVDPVEPVDPPDPPAPGDADAPAPVPTGDYSNMVSCYALLIGALVMIWCAVRRKEDARSH